MQRALVGVIESIENEEELLELLSALVGLLKTPPLKDEWCRISAAFSWLIPSAMAATKALLAKRPSGPFPPAVLATVAMGEEANHLRLYTGDVEKDAKALLSANRDLKHAVFWREAQERRAAKPSERIVDPWRVSMSHGVMALDAADAPLLLGALRDRALVDDRLIALSRLMTLYAGSGRPAGLLKDIEDGVRGSSELEAALRTHLSQPQTAQREAHERSMRELEERHAEERARKDEERQQGIAWLTANVNNLAIGDHAKEGQVLTNIVYLHGEVAEKTKNGSHWSVSGWQLLEAEFGPQVAAAFRDYCTAYWRLFRPELQSERGGDSNSTPWGVILGLSGLAMEAKGDRAWATKLSNAEAALATRYALWELNGLPTWFSALFDAHPEIVKGVLIGEMRWELVQPRSKNSAGYVFSRLRWTSTGLGNALRGDIVALLAGQPAGDPIPLGEALTVVLRVREPLPSSFAELVEKRVSESADDNVKGLWLAGLLCIRAEKALPLLEEWVAQGPDAETRERRVSLVLEHVWGDSFQGFSPEQVTFKRADVLLRLIKLSHMHVDPEKDVRHEDVYSPDLRDHAQEARDRLVKILSELPGRATYDALFDLSAFYPRQYPRERMLVLAEGRAETDTEHEAWAAEDLDAFATAAERGPRTQKDLFELALSRLDDLKLELEEGDESEASLLQRVADEIELRKVIANRLRNAAAGKYTTGSEEELADTSRTDIRLHHPEVEARIPIELKIADAQHWSAAKLRQKMEEQLGGQYMLEARYGVFLLVRRGAEGDRKTFPHKTLKKIFGFDELSDWLRAEARELMRANPSIDGLEVVSIDLKKRSGALKREQA